MPEERIDLGRKEVAEQRGVLAQRTDQALLRVVGELRRLPVDDDQQRTRGKEPAEFALGLSPREFRRQHVRRVGIDRQVRCRVVRKPGDDDGERSDDRTRMSLHEANPLRERAAHAIW